MQPSPYIHLATRFICERARGCQSQLCSPGTSTLIFVPSHFPCVVSFTQGISTGPTFCLTYSISGPAPGASDSTPRTPTRGIPRATLSFCSAAASSGTKRGATASGRDAAANATSVGRWEYCNADTGCVRKMTASADWSGLEICASSDADGEKTGFTKDSRRRDVLLRPTMMCFDICGGGGGVSDSGFG